MRNCVLGIWIIACCFIGGCGFMDMLAGVQHDEHGNVIKAQGGVAEIGFGLLAATGGVSGLAGTGLGWLLKAYRTKRIIDAGGRDDNFDQIPDPPAVPPTPKI